MRLMSILPIKQLKDNYAYILYDPIVKEGVAIDPVEPRKVLEKCKELSVNIVSLFITHHHLDHAGGNAEFLRIVGPSLKIYGGDERIQALTDKIYDGEEFTICDGIRIKALATPCHTSKSLSYFVYKENDRAVFTGDTLFIGGCGRFFEGNAHDMYNSLVNVLGSLPGDTKVYCGHEYTLKNLMFAAKIEPNNSDIKQKIEWCKRNEITVPSTIAEEKTFNPFFRVEQESVRKFLNINNDKYKVMEKLREMKNNFN
jgi:hydroxyacylglutathione hydrolase